MTSSFNGGMSWQQYNNNHQSHKFPHGALRGEGSGDVQDMHLKMSKKIAQLTKVIYALNTKNDEHESVIAVLKENHEEEIQKLLAISTSKIQEMRYQKSEESDLKRKVENLQQQIGSFEAEKRKTVETMERLQQTNKNREVEMEEQQLETIESYTRQLHEAKLAFESRIADLQRQLAYTEREKNKNEDSKNMEYQRQICDLKRKIDSQELTFAKRISEVEEERDRIRGELSEQIESSEREINKLRSDCDEKLEKAKAFYEHELTVARQSVTNNEALMAEWKKKEHQMKVDADKQESKYRKKIQELGNELEIRQEEIDKLKKDLDEVGDTDIKEQKLRTELRDLQEQYDDVSERVTFLSNELDVAKMKMKSQVNDINQKSSIIGTLEAIKLTQDESIIDLEEQLKEKKQQLLKVEEERNQLSNNRREGEQERMEQLKAMATKLDKMQKEKEAAKREHEKDMMLIKEKQKEEMDVLKSAHNHQVENMEKNHQLSNQIVKKEAENTLEQLQSDLQQNYLKEKSQLEDLQAQQLAKMNNEKNEISVNYQHLQDEMRKVTEELEEKRRRNCENEVKLGDNMKKLEMMSKNCEGSEAKYNQAQVMIKHLRSELDGWRNKDDETKIMNEQRHIESLEKLKRDKDDEWEKIMRSKLSDMRSRLSLQLNSERQNALKELRAEKDKEMEAAKYGWMEQVKQLTTQISDMRGAHRSDNCEFEAKIAKMKSNLSMLRATSERKEKELATEFQQQMDELRCKLGEEEKKMKEEKEKEMENLSNEIRNKHREELHAQLLAHQVTMATMKENIEAQNELEIQRREEEFQFDLDEVKAEMMQRCSLQAEEIRTEHENKMTTMREEVEDTRNKWQQFADETKYQISEMECSLKKISNELQESRKKNEKQESEIVVLKKELESKVKDVLHARSEANLEIKRREEEMKRRFQDEQDDIEADRLRHKQTMVNEFNRATGLLKEKITDLKITIHELEDRHEKRESREEDLETISRLEEIINEREAQLQQIMDDKKYYEMELVNRETNFNKVFNSTPNVGVLNPRNQTNNKKKKTAGGGSGKHASPNHRHLEPLRHQTMTSSPTPSSSSNLQPTPPTIPKKSVSSSCSSSVDCAHHQQHHRLSKDFFSEEASSQLDSYDDVTGNDVTMEAVMRQEQQQRRMVAATSLGGAPTVWRSELSLYVEERDPDLSTTGNPPNRNPAPTARGFPSFRRSSPVDSSLPKKRTDRGGWFFSSLRKKK